MRPGGHLVTAVALSAVGYAVTALPHKSEPLRVSQERPHHHGAAA